VAARRSQFSLSRGSEPVGRSVSASRHRGGSRRSSFKSTCGVRVRECFRCGSVYIIGELSVSASVYCIAVGFFQC